MNINTLLKQMREQRGHIRCQNLADPARYKTVPFRHLILPPESADIPDIGGLPAFYQACGAAVFFYIESSRESARYLARPQDWDDLHRDCALWFDGMTAEEWQEIIPAELLGQNAAGYWLDALVIGETPHTGNYILMDNKRGTVYEFDHDGYTFTPIAPDLPAYAALTLNPDGVRLADYARHMRFIENDGEQWLIDTLHYADDRSLQWSNTP